MILIPPSAFLPPSLLISTTADNHSQDCRGRHGYGVAGVRRHQEGDLRRWVKGRGVRRRGRAVHGLTHTCALAGGWRTRREGSGLFGSYVDADMTLVAQICRAAAVYTVVP